MINYLKSHLKPKKEVVPDLYEQVKLLPYNSCPRFI
jgi:hypothetical protein